MTTRRDLRQRIGQTGWCGDMFLGTASAIGGAAGATLIDTKLTYADDKLNNGEVVITSGAADSDIRVVADWANGTGTLTPDRAFSAQIAAAVTYEYHRQFSATRKNEAIREAMELAAARWPRKIEDTSLTLTSQQYTYSLATLTVPVDPELGLEKVEYDSGGTGTGVPYVPLGSWALRNNDGVLTLQLAHLPTTGKTMRLTYRVLPTPLTDDTTTLKPADDRFENYIVAKATALIFEKAAVDADENERGKYTGKMNWANQLADGYLPKNAPAPGKVTLMSWGDDDDGNSTFPVDYGL